MGKLCYSQSLTAVSLMLEASTAGVGTTVLLFCRKLRHHLSADTAVSPNTYSTVACHHWYCESQSPQELCC